MYRGPIVLRCDRIQFFSRRWKSLASSKKAIKKISSTDKALEHFDDFYKPLFKRNWPSIRLGLLTPRKYIAVLNNYSDWEAAATKLENQGAINVKRLFDVHLSKLSGKRSNQKGEPIANKSPTPSDIDTTLSELSDRKSTEEIDELYPEERKELTPELSQDRYIDPSLGLSQLYEYVPAAELKGSEDWIRESSHFSYYTPSSDRDDSTVRIFDEDSLNWPDNLKVYSFEPGNTTSFPPPRKGSTGVSDYLLLDGGSLLPVLALDLKPEDRLLDLCAAPGGKSLIALQTLLTRNLTCNDVSDSRTNRIKRMFKEFLYDFDTKLNSGHISIMSQDGRKIETSGNYNKILVDVPCTKDRHSVTEDDNNIFKSSRLKERIRLPELQSQLLESALRLVSPGGIVVYSTCSLSPIQNDGVVHMALQKVREETNFNFVVFDLTKALQPSRILFKYGNIGLRYGHLVVPFIVNNFGPTYFCKIMKVR